MRSLLLFLESYSLSGLLIFSCCLVQCGALSRGNPLLDCCCTVLCMPLYAYSQQRSGSMEKSPRRWAHNCQSGCCIIITGLFIPTLIAAHFVMIVLLPHPKPHPSPTDPYKTHIFLQMLHNTRQPLPSRVKVHISYDFTQPQG